MTENPDVIFQYKMKRKFLDIRIRYFKIQSIEGVDPIQTKKEKEGFLLGKGLKKTRFKIQVQKKEILSSIL
jgi:hypothetical protein